MNETLSARIAFVIPALNEAVTIAAVVASVKPFGQALVVDDGSNDDTGILALCAGAEVLRHERRLGYDAAITDGIQYASDAGFDWAVTMDADGQHAEGNLPRVIASLSGPVDLVVGYRVRRPRFAEGLMALLFDRLWGIRDALCGLKAYRLELYRARRMHGKTYVSIGTEVMLQYLRANARVSQIPITIRPRIDKPRFGNRISANARILASLIIFIAKTWSRAS